MATKYILDPSGKIIKADDGDKIDPVDPGESSKPHYTEEVLKNISAKENDNDNNFDSFLSNVRLGLLEGEADQDRLTRYITSKVDQDPSFGFIDKDGKTKFKPDQVDSFKPFNSFTNTSKVFADEFEMLTGFRLRTNEFEESLQTTLLMFSYFAELIAKFATAEVIILLNQNQNIEINKKNIRKTSLRLGRYDFTEYDILTKYIYNVLNYPHESSSFSERIMAYFVGFTEWLSPDIVLDYNEILNQSSETYSNTLSYSKNNERVGDFSNILQDTFRVALISLLEILASTALNHTSINRVRLLLRKFYQERLFKQRDLYKAKPQNQFTESTEVLGLEVPSVDVLGFFDDLNYYYFKFMIERIQVGLPILLKYYYKVDMFNKEILIQQEHPKNRVSANRLKNPYGASNYSGWTSVPYDKVNKILKSTTRVLAVPQMLLESEYFDKLFLRMGNQKSKPYALKSEADKSLTTPKGRRLPIASVNKLEQDLESEYVPFYIHDVRTNEVLAFHAFIESISDSFSPEYNSSSGFGRIDDVKTYVKTTRNINLTFILAATSKDDHDFMWYQINKIVSLVYPQWSDGFDANISVQEKYNSDENDTYNLKFPFKYPFTQVPTASPLIRLRVGDVIKSNYSRENLARLHGVNENVSIEKLMSGINVDKFGNVRDALKDKDKALKAKEAYKAALRTRTDLLKLEDTQAYKDLIASRNYIAENLKSQQIKLNEKEFDQTFDEGDSSEYYKSDYDTYLSQINADNLQIPFSGTRLNGTEYTINDFYMVHKKEVKQLTERFTEDMAKLKNEEAIHLKWKNSAKNPLINQGLNDAEIKEAKKYYRPKTSDGNKNIIMSGMPAGPNPFYDEIFTRNPKSFLAMNAKNQAERIKQFQLEMAEPAKNLEAYEKSKREYLEETAKIYAERKQQERQTHYPDDIAYLQEQIKLKQNALKESQLEEEEMRSGLFMDNIAYLDTEREILDLAIARTEKKYTAESSAKKVELKAKVVNDVYKRVIDKKYESKQNNPITISYESGMSRGLAGFITNLDVGYNDSTWETDKDSRAPMLVKINIGFSPIHDIAPGLDHHGAMRAPTYNVGKINNYFFGDPITTNGKLNSGEE